MYREPNINLKWSDFLLITRDLFDETIAKTIFERGAKFPPARVILPAAKQKVARKVKSELRDSDVKLFNQILFDRRVDMGHKVMPISEADTGQWRLLKDISASAEEYCTLYGLDRLQGYTEYIIQGLKLAGKPFMLSKMKYYRDSIFANREKYVIVRDDVDPDGTQQLYRYFLTIFGGKHTKAYAADTYAYFVQLNEKLKEEKIKYRTFIEWCRTQYQTIPEPKWLLKAETIARFQMEKQ